ncbi:unnamed protein product, partial [Ilex paraguariensis]
WHEPALASGAVIAIEDLNLYLNNGGGWWHESAVASGMSQQWLVTWVGIDWWRGLMGLVVREGNVDGRAVESLSNGKGNGKGIIILWVLRGL